MFNGVENGRFGNFVEDNAVRVFLAQIQHFRQVPRDGFPLAVLIRSQPHTIGGLDRLLQLAQQRLFVALNLVFGFEIVFDVYAQMLLGQVANMPETRQHLIILSQKLLNGLGLGRRLHYN